MSGGAPWRGSVVADALLLDVALLGEAVVRERVLAAWRPGADVRVLPDGRWLLRLPEPERWRAETAPGVPVRLAPGGVARWTRHGAAHEAVVTSLPRVPVEAWVALPGPVEHLDALEAPRPPVAGTTPPEAARGIDLARAARVVRDGAADAVAAELGRRAAGRASGLPGPGRSPAPPGRPGRLAALVLRTPPGDVVARRHARYLRGVTEAFERRDYDAALRRAIALGGGGAGLSLRLPDPRRGALRASADAGTGGRGLAVGGPTVEQHLRGLYVEAARRLEAEGRVEEAAFVRADLLQDVTDAVRTLERHGRLEAAARLAEGRLGPVDAIALWWRAGDRPRALLIARTYGAFERVVERLGGDDALAWRREWALHRRRAGDPLGAVRAAWPEPRLRAEVGEDLRAALALGGPDAAEMFALQLVHSPTPDAVRAATGLLAAPVDDAELPARLRLVQTLATWRVEDPAADRRLATEALRCLVRQDALRGALPDATRKGAVRALRERADPLAVADLPRPGPPAVPADGAELLLEGTGALAVLDAAATPRGVLLALGPHGVRWCGPAGQVLARWDVPADGVVLADHGAAALLLVRGEGLTELHRLDLVTRRVTPWVTLPLRSVATSYDGGSLVAVDDRGVVVLDVTASGARELWRQPLRPGTESVLDLARDAAGLAAVIRATGAGELPPGLHLWAWTLPDLLLRARPLVDLPPHPVTSVGLTARGHLHTAHADPDRGGPDMLRRQAQYRVDVATPAVPTTVLGDGSGVVLRTDHPGWVVLSPPPTPAERPERWTVQVRTASGGDPDDVVTVGVRRHEGRVVVHADGAVLAFETATGRAIARFATRV